MRALPVLLIGALALGACSNANRGGPGGPGTSLPPLTAQQGVGSTADPSSPAYFSETVGDRVLFLVDQSTLTPEARQTLASQAQWLNRNPGYSAIIEGHADEQGTRDYNLALGARRAASARDFLVSQGVAASRLRTVTFGKERPLEICSVESCYQQNRRAVTVIATAGIG